MSKCEASQINHDILGKLNTEACVNLLINQYSTITFAFGLVVIAGLILLTNKPRWNDYLAFGVIILGLFTAWSIVHPRQTPLMDDAKMIQSLIGSGTPVLLEFQSPY